MDRFQNPHLAMPLAHLQREYVVPTFVCHLEFSILVRQISVYEAPHLEVCSTDFVCQLALNPCPFAEYYDAAGAYQFVLTRWSHLQGPKPLPLFVLLCPRKQALYLVQSCQFLQCHFGPPLPGLIHHEQAKLMGYSLQFLMCPHQ